VKIRAMTIEDYDAVLALWNASLASPRDVTDSREAIAKFLQRNPDISVVAIDGVKVVGSILCGHDGRRGFLYHVAVDESVRRQGVAQAMLAACLKKLRDEDIHKCALSAFKNNDKGNALWTRLGFSIRDDIYYRDIWLTEEKS